MTSRAAHFYVTGGALGRDAPSYVTRQADEQLCEWLLEGQYCHVLTARQMGKSSLMVRTVDRLRGRGAWVVVLDLTAVGQNLTPEQWYASLLWMTGKQLGVSAEAEGFWTGHGDLAPLHRFMQALRQVVLDCGPDTGMVIFVDEIDAVRSLPFSTDEFFAGIRELYNRRALEPGIERLTFCLLGVAAPSDLIRDTRSTPYNVGRRVELHDFTEAEAAPLAAGMGRDGRLSSALLRRVLHWTGGHPYLTQRLCDAVAKDAGVTAESGVDRLCRDLFLSRGADERDSNLLFVREHLLRGEGDRHDLLGLYSQVLRRRRVPDDETDPRVTALRLSGVARAERGRLVVRNRIYARAFDHRWVEAHTEKAELRRQREAYRRGLWRAAGVAALVLVAIAGAWMVALRGWRLAEEQRSAAEAQERANRLLLYVARMNLAQQAWEGGNVRRVIELLEASRPRPGEEDLRGFEWHRLWRLSHGEAAMFGLESAANAVAFSPDGRLLAVGVGDGSVRLLEVLGRREVAFFRGHTGGTNAVAFSPDGRLLATGGGDGTAKVWDASSGREVLTLNGHRNAVNCLAFSHDGTVLATGSRDSSVRLWRVSDGEQARLLGGHAGEVYSTAFSPGGRTVAVRSGLALKLWEASGAGEATTVTATVRRVDAAAVAFSPDGRLLAESAYDEVALWDVATLKRVKSFEGHAGGVHALAFAPDGGTLATAGEDGALRLWEARTGQISATIMGHTDAVRALAFSPDGKTLATAGADRTVRLWDLARRQEEPVTLRGHESHILFAAFSPDGQLFATGGNDMRVKVWETSGGREVATLQGPPDAFSSGAFSPDGRLLATGGHDNRVRLWDVGAAKEIKTFGGHGHRVTAVAYSYDGRLLATGGADHAVKLWEVASGRELLTIGDLPGPPAALAFSRDGSTLSSYDGLGVRVWDVADGREMKSPCECRDLARAVSAEALHDLGSGVGVGVADYEPDRYTVPSTGSPALPPGGRSDVPRTRGWHKFELRFEEGGLRMLIDDQEVAGVPGDYGFDEVRLSVSGPVWRPGAAYYFDDVCVTRPDAGRSFCDDFEGAGLDPLWRVMEENGKAELSPEQSRSGARSLKLMSADGGHRGINVGRHFDAASKGSISAWFYDTAPGAQTLYAGVSAFNHSAPVYASKAVSPDGSTLAAVIHGQAEVKLWETGTGREVGTLAGHAGPITCVAFSPDGRRIATGGEDRTVKLWDVETGREVGTLAGHTDAAQFMLFSPEGTTLAVASRDRVVKLWHSGARE